MKKWRSKSHRYQLYQVQLNSESKLKMLKEVYRINASYEDQRYWWNFDERQEIHLPMCVSVYVYDYHCHHVLQLSATMLLRVYASCLRKIITVCGTYKTVAHERIKGFLLFFFFFFKRYSKSLVLLTTQIHQGIRFSSLKVLVSRVFRPASNLLLRLLHIWNNATFTLLHLNAMYGSGINYVGGCFNRTSLHRERNREREREGGLSLTTSHVRWEH